MGKEKFTKRLIIVSLIVAGISLFGYFGHFKNRDASNPLSSTALRFNWHPDDRQAYQLRMSSVIDLGDGRGQSGQKITQTLSGELHLRVYAVEDDQVEVGYQLAGARLAVSAVADDKLNRSLSQLFQVRYTPEGTPLSARFPKNMDRQHQAVLWEVIRAVQVILPSESNHHWQTMEENATGKYVAEYQMNPDGSLSKTKVRFTTFEQSGEAEIKQGQVKIHKSEATVSLCVSGSWIRSLQLEEDMAVSSGGAAVIASRTWLALDKVDTWKTADLAIDRSPFHLMAADSSPTADGDVTDGVDEDQSNYQKAPGSEDRDLFDQLMADLMGGNSDRQTLFRGIRSMLDQYGELAYAIPEFINDHQLTDRAAADLIHLLELAGHEDAQIALTSILQDGSADHLNRIRATIALSGITAPTEATLENLWDSVHSRNSANDADLSNTALLAIGSIAAELRDTEHHDVYQDLSSKIVESLDTGSDPEMTSIALKAISNTGDPQLSGIAQGYLDDPNPRVRAAAANVTGMLPNDDAAIVLASRLPDESNRRVRHALSTGLFKSKIPDLNALETVNSLLPVEKDECTRFAMVRYMGSHLDAFPQGRATLKGLFQREPSKRIRQVIATSVYATN